MSAEEMRSFCQRIRPYGLRVQVRLKGQAPALFGKIAEVDSEQFTFESDDKILRMIRFAWVARISEG